MREFNYDDQNIKHTIERDYFDRNKYLTNLIEIINTNEECVAFSVDGEWGSGKTVFMHQFLYLLKDQDMFDRISNNANSSNPIEVTEIEGFYYNAWENELVKNPSINLLNSLTDEYSVFSSHDKENAKEFFDTLGNITLKLGSAGILSMEDFKKNCEVDPALNVSKVRNIFDKLVEKIKEKKNTKKVVVIVDELDRCRPSYALELLEEIKHFYENPSLCFIFSTNLTELANTIGGMYGSGFNASLYLQRFFDDVFSLNSCNYEKYIEEGLYYNISDTDLVNAACKIAINYNQLTIRAINKFIKKIKTIDRVLTQPEGFSRETDIAKIVFVPWGIAAKYRDAGTYNRFKNGQITKEDIAHFMNQKKDFPEWVTDYFHQNRQYPQEIDIIETLYDIYKEVFQNNEFKYYRENMAMGINGGKVRALIEF